MALLPVQEEFARAIYLSCFFSAIVLIPSFLSGLLSGIFQALTSIQDQILAFAPRLIVVGLVLFFISGWMLGELQAYTEELFTAAARAGHSGS